MGLADCPHHERLPGLAVLVALGSAPQPPGSSPLPQQVCTSQASARPLALLLTAIGVRSGGTTFSERLQSPHSQSGSGNTTGLEHWESHRKLPLWGTQVRMQAGDLTLHTYLEAGLRQLAPACAPPPMARPRVHVVFDVTALRAFVQQMRPGCRICLIIN